MNKTAAKEWLQKAWHHFSSAKLLYEANHYLDIIAVELHYSIEIILKSFLAYENKKILRTHELFEIYELINTKIEFDESEIKLLSIATDYHIEDVYPSFDKQLPSNEEVKKVLDFTESLFSRVCNELNIDLDEIKVV
ncbi:MAG: HEPN domain-containing protein [Spirochaetales bacterium]|nr:HEPN domain-containing protein [Spirochaetales bacterium]